MTHMPVKVVWRDSLHYIHDARCRGRFCKADMMGISISMKSLSQIQQSTSKFGLLSYVLSYAILRLAYLQHPPAKLLLCSTVAHPKSRPITFPRDCVRNDPPSNNQNCRTIADKWILDNRDSHAIRGPNEHLHRTGKLDCGTLLEGLSLYLYYATRYAR